MKVYSSDAFQEVKIIEPDVYEDDRGLFFESFNQLRYGAENINEPFVQDNLSRSKKGVLRGLHFQSKNAQGKLVQVFRGKVFDVVVDIRQGSSTFKKWFGLELSEENKKQLWVPPGFAHGFLVLSDVADFSYKVTDFYSPQDEHTLLWNDSEIGIDWPLKAPVLSRKDAEGQSLSELASCLPKLF